jgi:hypothetical protein
MTPASIHVKAKQMLNWLKIFRALHKSAATGSVQQRVGMVGMNRPAHHTFHAHTDQFDQGFISGQMCIGNADRSEKSAE